MRLGFSGVVLAMMLMASWLFLGIAAPSAQAASVFTVSDISVDATAESATVARQTALARGHALAMQKLVQRLVVREDVAKVAPLSAEQIADLLEGFAVADERTSGVRYLATLTFNFQPDAVRGFLRSQQIRYAEAQSKPALVVPLFGVAGEALLWDEPNPWRETWEGFEAGEWLVPLIVPLGDLEDISAIDAADALSGNSERLWTLARRYGAGEVMVSQFVLVGDPEEGNANAQVITTRFFKSQPKQSRVHSLRQEPGEDLANLMRRGASTAAGEVQEAWKRANLLRFDSQQSVAVNVPVGELEDWLDIKRRLEKIATVIDMTILFMTPTQVQVELSYFGDEAQLAQALARQSLELAPSTEGAAVLRRRGEVSGLGSGVTGSAGQGSPLPVQTVPKAFAPQPMAPSGATSGLGNALTGTAAGGALVGQ